MSESIISLQTVNDQVYRVSGRVDSSNASKFEQLMATVQGEHPVLDIEELSYISSAGLRVLLGLSRKYASRKLKLINASEEVYSIFHMTGFDQLFEVTKALREIDITGCKAIGEGFYGIVYRLDEDTIVKVYRSADSIPLIENEQKMAKKAFLSGIPTAISYDIVRVGEAYGSVFEMLKAESFNDLVIGHPEELDTIMEKYINLLKQVHDTQLNEGEVPSAKQRHIDYVDLIESYVGADLAGQLKQYLSTIPESRNIVHGDFQMKNVLMSDGQPMLIDMETLSEGHPVFDLAGLYVTYEEFSEDEPNNSMQFLGISQAMSDTIWQQTLQRYFNTDDEKLLRHYEDGIRIVAAIRFLFILVAGKMTDSELGQIRIAHTKENIRELLEQNKKMDW